MLFFLLFYGIAIFSVVLYLIVTFLMIRERKYFSYVFLRLWIVFAVLNLITFCTMFVFYRIPSVIHRDASASMILKRFPMQAVLRIAHFVSYYSLYCQNLLLFMIAVNRLKVIAFPLSETLFEKRFWYVIGLILGLPLVPCIPIMFTRATFHYERVIRGYVLKSVDKLDEHADLVEVTVFQCVVAIANAILNTISIAILFRRSMGNGYRREFSLFLIGFLCFVLQMTNAVLTFLLAVYGSSPRVVAAVLNMRPMAMDCFALCMPYYTLILNLHIRKCFFRLPGMRILCLISSRESLLEKSWPITNV